MNIGRVQQFTADLVDWDKVYKRIISLLHSSHSNIKPAVWFWEADRTAQWVWMFELKHKFTVEVLSQTFSINFWSKRLIFFFFSFFLVLVKSLQDLAAPRSLPQLSKRFGAETTFLLRLNLANKISCKYTD